MLSDGIIVLYWIPITIILISIGQLTSFTTAFPKSRSGLQRRSSIVRASKNEIERPANFIDEKNMEQSLFNPPPRSKKMMNQRGVITDVEDVVVNLPLGEHFGSTFDETHTLPLFSTSTKSSTMYRSTYTLMWLSISIIVPFTVVALTDVEDCFTEYFHDFIYDDGQEDFPSSAMFLIYQLYFYLIRQPSSRMAQDPRKGSPLSMWIKQVRAVQLL